MQESDVAEMGEQEQFYWWHICRRLVWRSILDKWLLESDNPKILESSVSRRTPQNDDGERPTQNNDLMCHPGPTGQGPSSDSGSRPGFQIESGMTKRGEIAAVQQIGPPQNDDGERPTQNDDLMCHPGPTGQGPSSDSGSRPGFQIESGMTKRGEIAAVQQIGPPQNDDGERPTQNNDLMCHPGPAGQGPSSDSGSRPGFQIESGMTKRGEIAAVQQIGPPQNDDGERPTQNDDLMCHPGPTGQGPRSDSGSRPGFQIESG